MQSPSISTLGSNQQTASGSTPLEAKCLAVCREDERRQVAVNVGFNASRELLTGFTLIEILIVVAMFIGLSAMGLAAGIDTYQRYLFRSDLEKTAALLQKARSSAVTNIGQTPHGVYFGDPDNLILFRGASHTALPAYNFNIEKSKTVTYTDTCPAHEAVFDQLSGATADCQVTLSGIQNTVITINHEGGINW